MNHWKQKFFLITAGQTISLIGSSAVQFALIWWLASETDSPMMMAMAGLVAFIPQIILGPFAGVWVDRWKRKTVAICADLFLGVVALAFAGVFALGSPPYWTVCLVLGIRGAGGVFHTPAIQAIIPQLVPPDHLIWANGWSQFLQSGAFMLGPVLGAALYAACPMPIILLTDMLGAVIASGALALVKIPEIERTDARLPNFLEEFKEGFRALRADRQLFALALCAGLCMVFFLPLSSYYPLMASSYFAVSAWHGSVVELVYAAGMMITAFLFGSVLKVKRPLHVAYLGLVGMGVSSLACGLLPSHMWAYWVFAAACFFMGASGNVYGIPFMAYLQQTIPPESQGRVFSMIGTLSSLAMPLGLLLSSPVAERFGVPVWFLVTGIGVLTCVAVCKLIAGRSRE